MPSADLRTLLWMVVIFAVLCTVTLPSTHEWAEDEPYYLNGAAYMLEGQSPLVPVAHDGTPRFQKPVLFYWLVALAFKLLGINMAAGRAVSLAAALLTIIFLVRMGREEDRDHLDNLLPALILMSMYLFFFHARVAITDMTVTAGITGGMAFFADHLRHGKIAALYLSAVAFGVACMAKGPVAGGIIITAFIIFALWPGGPAARRLPWRHYAGPLMLFALLAGWWYLYMLATYGARFLAWQVQGEAARRVGFSPVTKLTNLLWYLRRIIESGYPWTLLVIPVFWAGRNRAPVPRPARKLSWCVVIANIIFYALLIDWRRTRYILPVLPFLSLIIGDHLAAVLRSPENGTGYRRAAGIMAAVPLALVLALGLVLIVASRRDMSVPYYLLYFAMLLFATAWTVQVFIRRHPEEPQNTLVAVSVAMMTVFAFSTLFFQGLLKQNPVVAVARATHQLEDGSLVRPAGLRRHFQAGLFFFFADHDKVTLEPGRESHRVLWEKDFHGGTDDNPEVVFSAFRYTDMETGAFLEALRNGDLLQRLGRERVLLVEAGSGDENSGGGDGR